MYEVRKSEVRSPKAEVEIVLSYFRLRTVIVFIRVVHRFPGGLVGAVGPVGEILQLAAFTAERPPERIDGVMPAKNAERRGHPAILYCRRSSTPPRPYTRSHAGRRRSSGSRARTARCSDRRRHVHGLGHLVQFGALFERVLAVGVDAVRT